MISEIYDPTDGACQNAELSALDKKFRKENNREVNKNLGNALRYFRKLNGLSLYDVSKKIGVSYQQVQKYEAGKCHIAFTTILNICELTNINFYMLMGKINYDTLKDREKEFNDKMATFEDFMYKEYEKYQKVKKLLDQLKVLCK